MLYELSRASATIQANNKKKNTAYGPPEKDEDAKWPKVHGGKKNIVPMA